MTRPWDGGIYCSLCGGYHQKQTDACLRSPYDNSGMLDLDPEVKKILLDNRWDLYDNDPGPNSEKENEMTDNTLKLTQADIDRMRKRAWTETIHNGRISVSLMDELLPLLDAAERSLTLEAERKEQLAVLFDNPIICRNGKDHDRYDGCLYCERDQLKEEVEDVEAAYDRATDLLDPYWEQITQLKAMVRELLRHWFLPNNETGELLEEARKLVDDE